MTLIEALQHQRQIDADGTEVGVSRQAVDEAIERIAALESENGLLREAMSKTAAYKFEKDVTQLESANAALKERLEDAEEKAAQWDALMEQLRNVKTGSATSIIGTTIDAAIAAGGKGS